MFFTDVAKSHDGRVAVVGEFSEVDGDHAILKVEGNVVKIQHNGLDKYKAGYMLVNGYMENGVLVEESAQKIDDEFDWSIFLRLANISSKYPEIF